MFKTTKQLINKGYNVVYEINNNGKTTRIPKLHICPACKAAATKNTDNVVLQRKAALHVVVGTAGTDMIALCSHCGFTKTN